MKLETETKPNSTAQVKPKANDADKYTGFIEPEISEILKDSIFLSLIQSDGIGVDNLISIINSAKINL